MPPALNDPTSQSSKLQDTDTDPVIMALSLAHIAHQSQYMQDSYFLAFGSGPLSTESNRRFALAEWERCYGWGDVDYDIQKEMEARLTMDERLQRDAKLAADEAETKRLEPMIALHHQQQSAMVNRARNARNKDRVGFKDPRPCRSLYDYDRVGGCKTRCVSTECWAHEFTDALTTEFLDAKGKLTPMAIEYGIPRAIKNGDARIGFNQMHELSIIWSPHGCWMTHPGEPGWNPKWLLNRNAEPLPPPPPQRHAPARSTPQTPFKPSKKTLSQSQTQNRFALHHLDD